MKNVQLEVIDRIGFITLNRPEKRNALNAELISELKEAFGEMESNNAVKVIVLRANGESFCAGADLGYLQQLQKFSFEENLADSSSLKELFHQIYTLKKVVIAQVEGSAIAGGCGLATICDFIFAVPEAKFGYTEVRIGFIPAIVMVFLIRKIGEQRAKELLLSGELITSQRAHEVGMISRIVPRETIKQDVVDFAKSLVSNNSGESMARTKQMIAAVQSMSLEHALSFAAEQNAHARATDDCKKGIASFLNKEKLSW